MDFVNAFESKRLAILRDLNTLKKLYENGSQVDALCYVLVQRLDNAELCAWLEGDTELIPSIMNLVYVCNNHTALKTLFRLLCRLTVAIEVDTVNGCAPSRLSDYLRGNLKSIVSHHSNLVPRMIDLILECHTSNGATKELKWDIGVLCMELFIRFVHSSSAVYVQLFSVANSLLTDLRTCIWNTESAAFKTTELALILLSGSDSIIENPHTLQDTFLNIMCDTSSSKATVDGILKCITKSIPAQIKIYTRNIPLLPVILLERQCPQSIATLFSWVSQPANETQLMQLVLGNFVRVLNNKVPVNLELFNRFEVISYDDILVSETVTRVAALQIKTDLKGSNNIVPCSPSSRGTSVYNGRRSSKTMEGKLVLKCKDSLDEMSIDFVRRIVSNRVESLPLLRLIDAFDDRKE